jgi:uncharacterized protein
VKRQINLLLLLFLFSFLLACLPLSSLSFGASATPTVKVADTPVALNSPAPVQSPAPTLPSTVAPAVTKSGGIPAERTIQVTALAVNESKAEGNAHQVQIDIRPKTTPGMSVGFFEQTSGGVGPMWRSAAWTATTAAALLLGVDLSSYQISFTTDIAAIDGPSASGLMTVAVLAGILGDDVRSDAAMTGTINPDGTIGPVGGVPQKIEGAAQAGKKFVVVPIVNRTSKDLKSNQMVDVVDWGRKLGVQVQPVSTVYEAYQAMTGKELPRPTGSGDSTLDAREAAQFVQETTALLQSYNAEIQAFNSLPENIRAARAADVKQAADLAQQSAGELNQGLPDIASQHAFEALTQGASLDAATRLDQLYVQGDYNGMVSSVTTALGNLPLDATLQHLQSQPPQTATDAILLMDAYSDAAAAFSLAVEGTDLIKSAAGQIPTGNPSDAWLNTVYRANGDFSDASVYLELTEQMLKSYRGFGKAGPPDPARAAAMADTLEGAAEANLTYFESLLDDMAQSAGVDAAQLRSAVLAKDGDYRNAKYSMYGINYAADKVAPGLPTSLMTLGNSLNAYAYSAVLIAKYYSLDAQLDKDFNITGFGDQQGLIDMLSLAEQHSGQLLQLVSKEEPVTILFYHNNARFFREQQAQEKVLALFYFWEAAAESQVLANFSQVYPAAIQNQLTASGRSVSPLLAWGWRSK